MKKRYGYWEIAMFTLALIAFAEIIIYCAVTYGINIVTDDTADNMINFKLFYEQGLYSGHVMGLQEIPESRPWWIGLPVYALTKNLLLTAKIVFSVCACISVSLFGLLMKQLRYSKIAICASVFILLTSQYSFVSSFRLNYTYQGSIQVILLFVNLYCYQFYGSPKKIMKPVLYAAMCLLIAFGSTFGLRVPALFTSGLLIATLILSAKQPQIQESGILPWLKAFFHADQCYWALIFAGCSGVGYYMNEVYKKYSGQPNFSSSLSIQQPEVIMDNIFHKIPAALLYSFSLNGGVGFHSGLLFIIEYGLRLVGICCLIYGSIFIFRNKTKADSLVHTAFSIGFLGFFVFILMYILTTDIPAMSHIYNVSYFYWIAIAGMGFALDRMKLLFRNTVLVLFIMLGCVSIINHDIPVFKSNVTDRVEYKIAQFLAEEGFTRVFATYRNSGLYEVFSDGAVRSGSTFPSDMGVVSSALTPFYVLSDALMFDGVSYEDGLPVAYVWDDAEENAIFQKTEWNVARTLSQMVKIAEFENFNIYQAPFNILADFSAPIRNGQTRSYFFAANYAYKSGDDITFTPRWADSFVTLRAGEYVSGPYKIFNKGKYRFILHYEYLIKGEKTAVFKLLLEGGNISVLDLAVPYDGNSMEFEMEFAEDTSNVEFFVWNSGNDAGVITLNSLEVTKIN
jgi:hypothetical protein